MHTLLRFLTLCSFLFLTTEARSQWEYLGIGTNSTVDLAAHGNVLLITGDHQTKVSTNSGTDWTVAREADFNSVTWAGSGFYLGKGRGEDFLTDAQGQNWMQRGYCSYEEKYLYFDTTTGGLYAANMRGNALLKSTDTGGLPSTNTWLPIGGGPQDQTFVQAHGQRIVSYYNGINGLTPAGLVYSTDGGLTWAMKSWPFEYFGTKYGYTTGAYVTPNGTMYATSATGPVGLQITTLWRSVNSGETWDSLFAVNEVTPILLAGTIYSEGKNILFSAGIQMWLSNDDGATWKQMQDGIDAKASGGVREIALTNGQVVALLKPSGNGQDGFGMYRRPMSDFGFTGLAAVSAKQGRNTPLSIRCHADGHVALEINSSIEGSVRISAVDVLGREVRLIHQGDASVSNSAVAIPSDLRGFYLIRVETDSGSYSVAYSN